jgi:hypothetical protein
MGFSEDSSVKAPREFPYSFGAILDLVFSHKSLLEKEKLQVKSKKKEVIICYQKEILLCVELLFVYFFSLQL